ncbi:hypothetical protein ASG84_06135 [Rhodococcus sp. Leaf278]|uniref:hypothetical protein n=1 Tax=Rhodococcus sp. Leaf278 TaxID=1736319 RepID=UPI00070E2D89|nr:hypothetical protein [Rhodococcus sp. Leaf278]KQU49491.1 hypothetical protein ASG84_06135 [Rhodococcus sp. Leaf278]
MQSGRKELDAPTKLVGFFVGIAFLFLAALFVGDTIGPDAPAATAAAHTDRDSHDAMAASTSIPAGLQATQDGYTLELDGFVVESGPAVPVAFTIRAPDGAALTDFDEMHTKELHLIVVRRDLTDFQHVHPTRDASGTWSTALDLTTPGSYRLFADFTPAGGENITLGAELTVPGDYRPQPLSPPNVTSSPDGYDVTLSGALAAGEESTVALTIEQDGREVTDLEPYLGAYGHLVALRADDLAYLHVHPEEGPPGPTVDFTVDAPTAGTYALYLDFQHVGVVHTAEFTIEVQEGHA